MHSQDRGFGVGLTFALFSAFGFGMSGSLATGLLAAGWTPLGIVIPRASIGALVMLVPALVALRGRWGLLRRNWLLLVSYGVFGITAPQLGQFSAVQYMQVAQALLIQFLAPLVIVVGLWLRRGERPSMRTVLGSLLAVGGLMLVLQVNSGDFSLDIRGLLWAGLALAGNTTYFVFSAENKSGLPPIVLAAGGMLVAAITLILVGFAGILPLQADFTTVTYAGVETPWWLPLVVLGVISSAASYITGIFGARLLGPRLASFVGLSEVLFAIIVAAFLVGQILAGGQLIGGVLVLAGVVLVKLGEQSSPFDKPASARRLLGASDDGTLEPAER